MGSNQWARRSLSLPSVASPRLWWLLSPEATIPAPKPTKKAKRFGAVIPWAIACALFYGCGPSPHPAPLHAQGNPVQLSATHVNGQIYVDVKGVSRNLRFVLDSGSWQSFISKRNVGKERTVVDIGGHQVHLAEGKIEEVSNGRFTADGTLGIDFLAGNAIGIDYDDPNSPVELWPGGVTPALARAWLSHGESGSIGSVPMGKA